MKILHLTLKKQWFDMIASGEKKEEYREIKEHYVPQLLQLEMPFEIPNSNTRYDKVRRAFNFCVGYKGTRVEAAEYLVDVLHIASYRMYSQVVARNGYAKDAPVVRWKHQGIRIGEGRPEWGAVPGVKYFILEIGDILTGTELEVKLPSPLHETENK